MSEIEKMKKYIERTKMETAEPIRYAMDMSEAFELARMTREGDTFSIEALSLAFDYGRAKGYRAAKAEGRARG